MSQYCNTGLIVKDIEVIKDLNTCIDYIRFCDDNCYLSEELKEVVCLIKSKFSIDFDVIKYSEFDGYFFINVPTKHESLEELILHILNLHNSDAFILVSKDESFEGFILTVINSESGDSKIYFNYQSERTLNFRTSEDKDVCEILQGMGVPEPVSADAKDIFF